MGLMGKTTKEIKAIVDATHLSDYPEMIKELSRDSRAGVNKMAQTLEKRLENHQMEMDRLTVMKQIEESFRQKGFKLIAGMDEVGRGPLAGPVVSCAIVLPEDSIVEKVNDSKKLSAGTRSDLYDQLLESAVAIGVGVVENTDIDEINILQATKKSMRLALNQLKESPDLVLVDAVELPGLEMEQKAIIKGDERCYSIAAASIIAKVYRDRMMALYHEEYPMYQFRSNKGYGSKEHIDAIKKYGLCPIHRRSFCTNFL